MGIGCVCQVSLPLGRKTHMGEPSQMCMALPQEAKVASERLMGHLALCVLTRETGKSFLKNSSGFWQRFQGTGLKAARWPRHTFSLSIFAFLFPTVSHHPASLASSSHFFFGVLPSPNDFCLSFHLPCHLIFLLSSFIRDGGRRGHFVRWKDTGFGMQPGLSAQPRNFLK